MVKSKKKQAPPPAPPLPPWQRLHKPVAPPKTSEQIAAEEKAAEEKEASTTAAAAEAAGVLPTDSPSDEPNEPKFSGGAANLKDDNPPSPSLKTADSAKDSNTGGEANQDPTIASASKTKKKGPPSKKSNRGTPLEVDGEDEDSDDEPIFKDFKAVKCPRTSVSAEAYAKRLKEGEEGPAGTKTDAPPPRRGKRSRDKSAAKKSTTDASADDIDALAVTVAESSDSFDVAAAVAQMPSRKKKPAKKSKSPPKKKGASSSSSSAKAPKKSVVKSAAAAKKPAAVPAAAAAATPTKRRSPREKANDVEEEKTTSPQRSSSRQRTQAVQFTITDAPASSAVHGEYTTEEQVSTAKKTTKEPKKRKSAEPAAGAKTKTKKVGKKDSPSKKTHVDDLPPLPPISPRTPHVTSKMEATWNERMKMLKEHQVKYGTTDLTVAEKADVNQLLRSFVFEQRKQHKKYMSGKHSSLTAERIKELSDMGFEFDPMSSGTHKANNARRFQDMWNVMYDELVQFKNENGHALVPLGKNAKVEVSRTVADI